MEIDPIIFLAQLLLHCFDLVGWWKKLYFSDVDLDEYQSVEVASGGGSGNFINDIQGDVVEKIEDGSGIGCSTGIYEYLVSAFWMCLVAVITAVICRVYYKQKLRDRLDICMHQLLQSYTISDIFKSSPELQRYSRSPTVQRNDLVNQLVDLILLFCEQHVIEKRKRYIPGPDLKSTFQQPIVGVPATVNIAANNGFIGDLSTVYRTSSFSLDGNLTDSEFTLFGSLGLSKLKVKYKNYKVDFSPFLYLSGSLTAVVNSNSIYIQVTASLQNLKSLKIKKYDIRIRAPDICIQLFDGGRNWSPVYSGVVNWVIVFFKSQIVDAVEQSLRNMIDNQLNKMGWQVPLAR